MKKQLPITSPCISVCAINEYTGFCKGCYRTIEEIAEWEYADDARKRDMLLTLDKRKNEDKSSRF